MFTNYVVDKIKRENDYSASQNIVYIYMFPKINTAISSIFFRLKLLAVEVQLVGVLCQLPEGDETMNIVCFVRSSSLDSHWNIDHQVSLAPVLTSSTSKKAMRSILLKVGD